MFDEPLGGLRIDAEGLRGSVDLRLFFHAGDPAEILRLQRGLDMGMDGIRTVGNQRFGDAPAELFRVRTMADEVKERARIQIIAQLQIT